LAEDIDYDRADLDDLFGVEALREVVLGSWFLGRYSGRVVF
jgi:hypothetical protein